MYFYSLLLSFVIFVYDNVYMFICFLCCSMCYCMTISCLFICVTLNGYLGCTLFFFSIINNATMIIFIHPCEFLYNMYLKMELLGHKICKSQLYQMLPKCFPKLLKQFRTLLESTEGFHCSTSSPSLVSSGFLIFTSLIGNPHYCFDLYFLDHL